VSNTSYLASLLGRALRTGALAPGCAAELALGVLDRRLVFHTSLLDVTREHRATTAAATAATAGLGLRLDLHRLDLTRENRAAVATTAGLDFGLDLHLDSLALR